MCPECHTRLAEWDRERGGDPHAYVTSTLRCPGCELIETERDHVPQGPSGYGVKIQLRPRHLHRDHP
ncbi:hypothetical protein [Streptomyces fractus]|uniref:hypothetical protein n=1 Tax=Streptomyces fractus TaxID=641806 RepID=UPI003CFBB99E